MPATKPPIATDSAVELHDLIGDDSTATFENDPKFIDSNPTGHASSENVEMQRDTDDTEDSEEEEDELEDEDDLEDEDELDEGEDEDEEYDDDEEEDDSDEVGAADDGDNAQVDRAIDAALRMSAMEDSGSFL